MNLIEYYLSRTFLTICGWFFSVCPIDQKKVVFASARGNAPTGNLAALKNAYQTAYPHGHYIELFQTYSYGFAGKISYLLSLVKTTYHLKTARYFFIDNALFPVHVVKHKAGTTVIQVWHATGALKRFGLDTDVADRKVENRFLHKGYDYVIADSELTKAAYTTAFGVDEAHVALLGSARTDALLATDARTEARAKLAELHPALAEKTILLYAPTFRGFSANKRAAQSLNSSLLKKKLGSQYALVYKPHAVVTPQEAQAFDYVLDAHCDINTYLAGFDGLITDYSSVLFEAALCGIPVFKLCGDIEKYRAMNGFYLDYLHEIPGDNCASTEELVHALQEKTLPLALNSGQRLAYKDFCARYCTFSDGNVCARYLEKFPLN